MQVMVMCDQKIRELKARYLRESAESYLGPVLEFPENGLEESEWDELCVQFLTNGNCIVVCSMGFAMHLAQVKERLDRCNELLSEAVEKSGFRYHELADMLANLKNIDWIYNPEQPCIVNPDSQ